MPEKETTNWKIPYPTSTGEVKLGATDMEESAKAIDKILTEHVLIVKKYAGSGTLASGELAVQEKTGETFTLPAVGTANQVIGIFSTVAETKVTAGANIIGDLTAGANIKLNKNQHVVVQSNATNWMIVAGEPQREQTYLGTKVFTKAEAETGEIVSTERPVLVVYTSTTAASATIEVGLEQVATVENKGCLSFFVPPGLRWKSNQACTRTYIKL
ncbi:MAG TPA: hypothetical protein VMI13_01060 [Solirubrobacteraceae bacterium]|nr:hypothetical protein [Solirubrobacteraceae bacterium]